VLLFGMMSCLLLREKEEVAARINYEIFMCLLVCFVCVDVFVLMCLR